MAETKTYVCKEGASNKYWKYTLNGKHVRKEWGRIGGESPEVKEQDYLDSYEARRDIEKQAAKKLIGKSGGKNKYVLVESDELTKEVDIAQTIGTRWKISRMEFVSQKLEVPSGNCEITISKDYDPDNGVFVEMLESWTKEKAYLLITKNNSYQFHDIGESNTQYGERHITLAGIVGYSEQNFVNGVRKLLKTLQSTVEEVVIQFGTLGNRILSLDGDEPEEEKVKIRNAIKTISAKTGASDQVICKFAALGNRVLEL